LKPGEYKYRKKNAEPFLDAREFHENGELRNPLEHHLAIRASLIDRDE
jgi:hypothetical protein